MSLATLLFPIRDSSRFSRFWTWSSCCKIFLLQSARVSDDTVLLGIQAYFANWSVLSSNAGAVGVNHYFWVVLVFESFSQSFLCKLSFCGCLRYFTRGRLAFLILNPDVVCPEMARWTDLVYGLLTWAGTLRLLFIKVWVFVVIGESGNCDFIWAAISRCEILCFCSAEYSPFFLIFSGFLDFGPCMSFEDFIWTLLGFCSVRSCFSSWSLAIPPSLSCLSLLLSLFGFRNSRICCSFLAPGWPLSAIFASTDLFGALSWISCAPYPPCSWFFVTPPRSSQLLLHNVEPLFRKEFPLFLPGGCC